MSEQQISKILEAIAELKQDGKDRAEAYGSLAKFMKDGLTKTNEKIDELSKEVQPIIDLSASVKGFDKISVWIMKFILGLAAVIAALGTIALFLKKMLTGTWGV